jgi:putative ABC transport system permease protein
MNSILRFWAIFVVSLKRLVAQRGLALATLLGIFVAAALTMSIPVYADGIYQRILNTEIQKKGELGRPPFAFMFRHIGSWSGAVPLQELAPLDQYLSTQVVTDLGLNSKMFVRYLKSDTLRLYPATGESYTALDKPLEWVSFGTLNNFEQHIEVIEGAMPAPFSGGNDTPMEILVSEALATSTGLQVGEDYVSYAEYKAEQTTITTQILVRVVGVWRPKDPKDIYWFYSSDELRTVFIIPESSYMARVAPAQGDTVYLGVWYYVMESEKIHSSEVPSLLGRIVLARSRAVNLLPTARLDISPEEVLATFQRSANSLTLFLYAFSIPILGMTLTFIGLVVDMVVSQRRNEIAVLRSRGATVIQVLGMAALESILLGIVGLALGAPGAQAVATFFSRAISFLNFSAKTQIQADITLNAIRFGLVAVGIAIVFMIVPTMGAAQHTVITYKQDRARQMRGPWWQRMYLDFILLLPAGYGIYLMKKGTTGLPMDPFQNPLLLLVPALGIFALTLLILRILPALMALVAWVASKTNSVGLLMAARYLARTSGGYTSPLILLILTLSLSTFTASLAQTLDRHTHDQTYYRIGSDISVVELGESTTSAGSMGAMGGTQSSDSTASTETVGPKWLFLPVSEHLKVPGVASAARVERATVSVVINAGNITSDFIGVDRVDFGQTAFWRRDFANPSLGGLMNDLARTSEGVLVSRDLLARGLQLGDNLRVNVYENQENSTIDFKVVGVFDYFPSWYPGEKPLIVGNLDYYFEAIGGENPYDVWLRLKDGANPDQVVEGVDKIYGFVMDNKISSQELYAAQSKPERQGFFGLLSVGFVALALLTVLGFLLYAYFSFRRRFIELGMLRAIGLSATQMIIFLGSEMAFLFIVGLAAGTGLGVWVSEFFIPQLQVGNDMAAKIPPFLVQINWPSVFQIYILFGLLFIVAMLILTFLLMRMKIFQAIKLGEAV